MVSGAEWSTGYARQADADFKTFEAIQILSVPECHKLQFLQMACEKLVKAHLCGEGTDPATLQASHAGVAHNLSVVLRQQAIFVNFSGRKAREALNHARRVAVHTPKADVQYTRSVRETTGIMGRIAPRWSVY